MPMKALPFLSSAALALAAMAVPAHAHDVSSGPVIAPGNTLLTLSADGKSTRTPDLARFNAGVTSQGKTAAEALAANSASMNKVIAALKRAGIADRDIQTSNLNLNPIYQPQRPMPDGTYYPVEPTIIGYQVNNTVNVCQRDIAAFGKVIDTLVGAGANQVNGPSFEMEKPDEALDEARTEAMKKARARADLYARAAGLKVARILTISESGGYYPQPPVMYAKAAMADMAAAAPTPVAPGEVSMNANVTVAFELAP
jgi:uncharacterized protein YggE